MKIPDHIEKVVQAAAQRVHNDVRLATLPTEDINDLDSRDAVLTMIGCQAGLFSAIVSNVEDLFECDMLDKSAHDRLYDKAVDLCKDVQVELQKQIARDLAAAGAPIDLSALDTAHEDAVELSSVDKSELH